MKNDSYIPDRGDIIWVTVDPSLGSEQKGNRPALVLSPKIFNQFGLAYIAPITSKIKGYNIEVLLPTSCQIQGAILLNQVFAADWRARNISYIETTTNKVLNEVNDKLAVILSINT